MRNALLATCICLVLHVNAQNPVPNASFENWTAGEPDLWTTSNPSSPSPTVMQVTTAHSGSFALKGRTVHEGGATYLGLVSSTAGGGNGFPVSQAYAFLHFYYMFDLPIVTEFNAEVVMQDATSVVGMGGTNFVEAGSLSTYTLASVPITYTGTPTECMISFAVVGALDSEAAFFIVDDVELTDTPTSLPDVHMRMVERIQPNPAQGLVSIYYQQPASGDLRIEVWDMSGRICLEKVLTNERAGGHRYDLEFELPDGSYMVKLSDGIHSGFGKLVVLDH